LELKLFTCADSHALDGPSNRVSAFHILEDLGAPSFPIAIPHLSIIAMLERTASESEDVPLTFKIYMDKTEQAQIPFDLRFQGKLRVRALADLHGVVVQGPGTLRIACLNKSKEIGSWSIQITQMAPPTMTPIAVSAFDVKTPKPKKKKARKSTTRKGTKRAA